jgi:cell division protein ZipA
LPPPPDEPEAVSDEEKIVALSVMAPSDQPYNGGDLRNALIGAGLKLTDQGVFRRGLDTHDGTVALFTVANIVEPGVFSSATLDHDQVPGVVFIMQLPGPFDGLSTFEQMLTTAQRLTQRLGGQVLDGRRCDLTGQAIEHIREELIEYRRRAKLASRRGG